MKIIIRVDGYNRIGLGHIYRTTSLAHHLSDHQILFVSKKIHKLGINFFKSQNFNIKTFTLKKEFYEIIANFEPDIIFNDILDTSADYIEYLKGPAVLWYYLSKSGSRHSFLYCVLRC